MPQEQSQIPVAAPVAAPAAPMNVTQLCNRDDIKARFNELMGKRSSSFIQSVISASKSPTLKGADPKTVLSAAIIAATLDMPINQNLGFAYIVPYNDKKQGLIAQFQMGWKGFYQLAMNSGIYSKITTNEVFEGELVVKNRFTEEFEFCPRTSNKIVGYLAYYKTVNGTEKYYYMTKDEVEAHAKKYSQSYRTDKYGTSQWSKNFDAMAKKTVLKLLLSKYGKLSIEMQVAQRFDQAVVSQDVFSQSPEDIQEVDITYIDNPGEETVSEVETVVERPNVDAILQAAQRQQAMAQAAAQFANQPEKDNKK